MLGAFRGIERAARDADRATKQRANTSKSALTLEERRYKEVEKYAAKIEQQLKREADVAAREAKRKADVAIREAKRTADATEREMKRSSDRAIREARRTAEREAKEAKQAAAEKARAHEHVYQIRQRYEAEQRRQQERGAAAQQRAAQRASDSRWRTIAGLGKDALFAGAASFGAGLGIVGGAAREGVRLQDLSNRLSINARGAGERGADPTALRKEFEAAALQAPGVKAADIAEGAAGFVAKTGDLGAARRFSPTFATVASATGSDVGDIANAAADIFQKFDVTGIKEMQEALAALTFQGKAGAFELKDAAAQFSKISAAAERFGVAKGAVGLRTLGGLTQIARSATGSPEQAATSVEAMFRQVIAQSKQLTAVGASPFVKGSTTKTRDIRDVLVDAISKNKGSLPALQKIFGEEGIRAVSPLISTFNQAKGGATGTEAEKTAAGVKALREALAKAIDAPGTWAEVVKDAAQAQKSAGDQLAGAWEQFKVKVAAEAVPAIIKLVPKLLILVDNIDPLITTFKALTETSSLLIDAFKSLGLLKEKTLTPEEQVEKAQKDLVAFNDSMGSNVPTAADVAKRTALEGAVAQATATALGRTGAEDKGTTLTNAEFAKRYAELGGGTEDERAQSETGARGLANKIRSGTASPYLETNDTLQSFLGENEAQQRLRQRFQSDVSYDQSKTGGDSGGGDLKVAAAELKSAAAELRKQANNKPSVFDGK